MIDESKSTFGTFEDRAIWLIGKLLPDFPKWGPMDAYACAGNLGRESDIQMIQEGGQKPPNGGWGLAQWTGPRRTQFMDYCKRSGKDPNAMSSGYAFLFVELTGPFANVIDLVAAAPDLPSKVAAFEQHYEMAGVVAEGDRLAFATRAQNAWVSRPVPVKPTPAPPPPVGTTPAPPVAKGTTMNPFSIGSLISLVSSAPSIIQGVMTIISEVEAGYKKGVAAGGDPVTIIEDIINALVANKGAVASAVLGPEPSVSTSGAIVAAPKVAVK